MSFIPNAAANATPNNNSEAKWKAAGFLNIWARRADGSRVKIGAIPLRQQKAIEAKLIERLQQQGGIEALAAAMELDFQLADKPMAEVNLGF